MSAHYAMCKYDDATGSYIPLEVRPITDKLKKDDPLYQEGFQAGAASRDAEVYTKQGAIEMLNHWNDQLRTELVKALAACKAKDEAILQENYSLALSFQPDDAALKAWLGAPVAWEFTDAFGTHYTDDQRDWMDTPGIESVTPLYSTKGLK